MNARRFVLVSTDAPARSPFAHLPPLRLQPIAWGEPDPALARACGELLAASTPKFRFRGLRCLLWSVTGDRVPPFSSPSTLSPVAPLSATGADGHFHSEV